MLLRRFDLHRPAALAGAFELLDRFGEDGTVYAGGTELLIALKARVLHYAHLIDLKGVKSLTAVCDRAEGLVIGALATHHQIATHPAVCELVPAYAALSDNIANVRVRCTGTIGGNLCFAEPHADPPALLSAIGARVRLEGPRGIREVEMDEFFRGAFETAREPHEIMTAVVVPQLPPLAGAAYRRFGHLERPAVGAAALIAVDGRTCTEARLRLGAIGSVPVRLPKAEAALSGLPVDGIIHALADAAAPEIGAIEASDDVHGSADYKRHLAMVLLRRAVAAALPGAGFDRERAA